jgi:hypothetical protein
MSLREVRTEIWDENGFVETKVEVVNMPSFNIDAQIQQKEEQLLSMYQELERLKALKGE